MVIPSKRGILKIETNTNWRPCYEEDTRKSLLVCFSFINTNSSINIHELYVTEASSAQHLLSTPEHGLYFPEVS